MSILYTFKNFKKQHVFEALCKILLMYDYDNGELVAVEKLKNVHIIKKLKEFTSGKFIKNKI